MIFTILEGNHYSNQSLYKLANLFNFKKTAKYKVKFNCTGIYEIPSQYQTSINKLFGFSSGMHHTKSARFGWNCGDKDKINIFAYCYINNERTSLFLKSIDVNKEYHLEITDNNTEYIFIITRNNSRLKHTIAKAKTDFKISYNLWPYFGGEWAAPHNVNIELTKF